MKKIKIGIIGIGNIAQTKNVPNLESIEGVEIAAAWSMVPEQAEQARSKFNIPHIVDDWKQIIDMPDLDAVLIATPPILHCPATLAALDAGKHVLCQARMARTWQEAVKMVKAAKKSDRVTSLFPPRPGWKADDLMKHLIHKDRYVGDILEVQIYGLCDFFRDPEKPYHWMMDREIFGINMMNVGMWVEIMHRWVGKATKVTAIGKIHPQKGKNLAGQTIQATVPNSLAVAAQLDCGATATMHFSFMSSFAGDERIEIYGSEGTLIYKFFKDELIGARVGEGTLTEIAIPLDEERPLQVELDFIDAIRKATPVTVPFEESLQYIEFCEAVHRSMRKGRTIQLPLPQDET